MSALQEMRAGDLVWWPDERGGTHIGRLIEVRMDGRVVVQVGELRKLKASAEVARWEQRWR